MKLYHSFGMNPRMVRFFLLEKALRLSEERVDILAGENRRPPYLDKNPAGQTPMLELDDGTCLCETMAICSYLEEQSPEPALIGRDAKERALTLMWWRRAEINISLPMVQAFYYGKGYDIFKGRVHCIPEAVQAHKEKARSGMRWLDYAMPEGGYLAGDRFSAADISLYCYIDQLRVMDQPIPSECPRLQAWFEGVDARPAAGASVWPEQPMGMRG